MKTKQYILILLKVLLLNVAIAQDIETDLLKINKAYENDYLSMSMKLTVLSANKPIDELSSTGSFFKVQNNIRTILGNIETVQNSKYMIIADNENKILSIDKPKMLKKPANIDMKTALEMCRSVEYFIPEESLKGYRFRFDKGKFEYKMIEIIFGANDYFIRKINFYSWSKECNECPAEESISKTVLEYSNISTVKKYDVADFSENKFITNSNGKFKSATGYQGYRIINKTGS